MLRFILVLVILGLLSGDAEAKKKKIDCSRPDNVCGFCVNQNPQCNIPLHKVWAVNRGVCPSGKCCAEMCTDAESRCGICRFNGCLVNEAPNPDLYCVREVFGKDCTCCVQNRCQRKNKVGACYLKVPSGHVSIGRFCHCKDCLCVVPKPAVMPTLVDCFCWLGKIMERLRLGFTDRRGFKGNDALISGTLIDWDNWHDYAIDLVARCRLVAIDEGVKYYGIMNYGECWFIDGDGPVTGKLSDDWVTENWPNITRTDWDRIGKAATVCVYEVTKE